LWRWGFRRKIGPLVADEVGDISFELEAVNLFFRLVASRHERASVMVTSDR
jgi:hypothetical protein